MASSSSSAHRPRLTQETRERFVADAGRALVEVVGAVQEKLSVLVNEAAPSREMQARRDAWTFFQRTKDKWRDGTTKGWQTALSPEPNFVKTDLQDIDALQLVGTDVVENKILASRLVLRVMDKVNAELDDLRLRIRYIEDTADLDRGDILRPEVLVLALVEQWAAAGMPSGSWPLVNDVVQSLLSERLKLAYHKANQHLIEQGVMPVIELKDRVKRSGSQAGSARPRPAPPRPPPDPSGPHSEYPEGAARAATVGIRAIGAVSLRTTVAIRRKAVRARRPGDGSRSLAPAVPVLMGRPAHHVDTLAQRRVDPIRPGRRRRARGSAVTGVPTRASTRAMGPPAQVKDRRRNKAALQPYRVTLALPTRRAMRWPRTRPA